MIRIWLRVLLAVSTSAVVILAHHAQQPRAIAQTSNPTELYYLYFGQKIPLTARPDLVAVKRSDVPPEQRRSSGPLPFYLELQDELEPDRSRGENPIPNGTYQPLREDYALVDLRNRSQASRDQTKQKLQQSKTVESVLTVLTRPGMDEAIVVPNEIIVSFNPQLSQAQIESILDKQGLEMLQVLSPKRKRYLVKSRVAGTDGVAILNTANQLYQVPGVRSATPNFIQSSPAANLESFGKESKSSDSPADVRAKLPQFLAKLSSVSQLQWHLDSSLLARCEQNQLDASCLQPQATGRRTSLKRTDVYAPEAWKLGSGGRGVVVAVMDSLIQTTHPDLRANLYQAKAADRCAGEVSGWDFYAGVGKKSTSTDAACPFGDPNVGISEPELNQLLPYHQAAFSVSAAELLKSLSPDLKAAYQGWCQKLKIANCDAEIVKDIRSIGSGIVVGSFHGTSVAGVITAKSPDQKGLTGIAPNAQLLPIRVAGFNPNGENGIDSESPGPEFPPSATIAGLEYAETRKADIINMSFGGGLPMPGVVEQVRDVLKDNPKLIIVAASGNTSIDIVNYPACIPGVLSVGATGLAGQRAPYSSYGGKSWTDRKTWLACGPAMKQAFKDLEGLDDGTPFLDVVAPGGELRSPTLLGGVLTAGGTFVDAFWQGIQLPKMGWGEALDSRGTYIWIQGTSFSSPAVAGVLALMKAEDPQRKLTRQQLIAILKKTASYDRLDISPDLQRFQVHKQKGEVPDGVSPEQYFFGSGLVNAEAAVREVKRQVGK